MNKEMVKVTIEVEGQEKQVVTGSNIMAVVAYQAKAEKTQTILVGEFHPIGMAIQLKNVIEGIVETFVEYGIPKIAIVNVITTMVAKGLREGFEKAAVEENSKDELLELLNLLKKAEI